MSGDAADAETKPDGSALASLDPSFDQQLELGREFMREFKDVFDALAK